MLIYGLKPGEIYVLTQKDGRDEMGTSKHHWEMMNVEGDQLEIIYIINNDTSKHQ